MFIENKISLENAVQRIEELETKITFQDHSIEELNQALIQQQNDINKLTRIVENVISQVERIGDGNANTGAEPPPPHY